MNYIDEGFTVLVCPKNYLHHINVAELYCLMCGAEVVSIPEDDYLEGLI